MKVLAIVDSPAEYSLDLIQAIYLPRNIEFAFIKGSSDRAANNGRGVRGDVMSAMSLWRRLCWIVKKLSTYDAFVMNGWTNLTTLPMVLLNAIAFRKPMSFESDTELSIPGNGTKRMLKRFWLHFLFASSWCYGFPAGRFDHEALFLHYGMDKDRIVTMPMVTRETKVKKMQRNDVFTFGFIGRLIALKQVDCMIEALAKVVAKGFDVKFVIVGDGPELQKLLDQVDRMGLSRRVRFTGAVFGEDKYTELMSMDCLMLNSTHDQWGLVVNEALSVGLPVIAGDGVGCRHELIEASPPTGLVIDRHSVESLAGAMERMASNEALWVQLHENALSRASVWNYEYYGKQFDYWVDMIERRCM